MDKKYQVFISSTFIDLGTERSAALQALLKSDCFPAGMELFPAVDAEQFEYIKEIIQGSDYYLIISAGRYGSIHPETKLSYTEMEYDYAVSIGKPTIRLLHKDPFQILPGKHIESSGGKRKKLEFFRKKLQNSNLVNYWSTPEELSQQLILALLDIKKRHPTRGWVRGENVLTVEHLREIDELKSQIAELKDKSENNTEIVVDFDDLNEAMELDVLVAMEESEDLPKKVSKIKIPNKKIAEAVFLSLLRASELTDISRIAGDILTSEASFPKNTEKFDYTWISLERTITLHFLQYLESRGLSSSSDLQIIDNYKLTPYAKRHANFISSRKLIR